MPVSLLLEPHYITTLVAIYNKAAMATKIAPIAPTNEPERMLAALAETVVGVLEVPLADPVAEVLIVDRDPVLTVPLLPLTPVAVAVEPVTVADTEPIPLPAPSDGESPEPDETTWPPVAALASDEAADDPLPLPPETAVELEDAALVEDWLLAELEDETLLQDKS